VREIVRAFVVREIARAFVVSQSEREDLQLRPWCSVDLRALSCLDATSRNLHWVASRCPG
jgi:hypothetical protein